MGPSPTTRSLDEIDRDIVGVLRQEPDLTVRALARRLDLAESTCAYRLRGLRAAGVISSARIEVDHAALGHPLQALIKLRLAHHSKDLVNALHEDLVRIPGVLQVFHVGGDEDFYLHVAVPDAEALRNLVLEHITTHAVVRQTGTQLVFEARSGAGIPLD